MRDDFVVRGTFVVALQIFPALLWDDGNFVIRPGESAKRVERFPQQDGDELDFVADITTQEVAAFKSGDFADAGEQFGFEHGLVRVRILRSSSTVPQACDHRQILGP